MPSGKFTWRIPNYSERQSERRICSDVFTVGGCNWLIAIFPKGYNRVGYLSMYLYVANTSGLPSGWTIGTKFSLTITNQLPSHNSTTKEIPFEFTAKQSGWGWRSFKALTELHDSSKGFLVNDTLIVEAEIEVLNVSPLPTVVLETFFSNLDKFITDAAAQGQNSAPKVRLSLKSEAPSLEEVEIAKKSLKECLLSDLYKFNMKDRLATSLETLSRAEIGLSFEEQRAVELFWSKFDDFVENFLTFEQENLELELHKLARDQLFHSIKKFHEIHLSNKRRLDDLTNEEEEYKKRMEEAKSKKAKLISDWQTLMTVSDETKSKYMAQEKKLEEAEERKRIAEERISPSIAAWSTLKSHFAN